MTALSGVIAIALALAAPPQGVDLAALDGWDIVVAEDAIPSERYAAVELQSMLATATGRTLPVVTRVSHPERHIFVGLSQAMCSNGAGFSIEEFGSEDLRIVIRDEVIVIAGGRPRGTLYGVYTFLEDYVGVRFLTPAHTHVPVWGGWHVVGPVDRFYHPPLFSRWSFYAETNRSQVFSARSRTNTVAIDPKFGGKTGLKNINHSFHELLNSRGFGADHPEYFPLIDGRRLNRTAHDASENQLCLTNPDVLRIVTQRVLQRLGAQPGLKNVSVSQNDCEQYCRCPSCAAIDEREGTPMGSLLTFVNAVADETAKEYPDTLIGTLAYSYSRKPPETVKPRPNVQIQLCSDQCCMLHPITDPNCPMNLEFCQNMTKWGKTCKNISIWNYNTNFAHYQLPCPNLRVIEPNIRYFVANGAMSVFMQSAYNTLGGEFSDLRNYMISNLLWDPTRSGEVLMDEFLRLHYKAAAPPIRRFITLTHDHAARLGLHHGYSGDAADFGIDGDIATAGLDAFAEALTRADDDVIRARVEKASICAYRAALEPFFALSFDTRVDPELLERMRPLLERFTTLCETFGVEKLAEGRTFKAFKENPLPVAALTGRRILQLPERWAFKTDPKNVGEGEGWFNEAPDDSWKPLSTHQMWEKQGYQGYDGYAWYTVEIDVPQVDAKTLWLLCGAVDEAFDLWVNGEHADGSAGDPVYLWDKPRAVDVSGKLKLGQKNRIALRVYDGGFAGGIWKPVWITASD